MKHGDYCVSFSMLEVSDRSIPNIIVGGCSFCCTLSMELFVFCRDP